MANMQRDPKKEAFWRDAIGRQARSGLSGRYEKDMHFTGRLHASLMA